MRSASRVGVLMFVAAMCVGCAETVCATNGRVFEQSETTPDSFSSALTVSASHDLPCGGASLDVRRLDPQREYAVTGCGWRVIYRVVTPSMMSRRLELVSRSPSPPTDHPAS